MREKHWCFIPRITVLVAHFSLVGVKSLPLFEKNANEKNDALCTTLSALCLQAPLLLLMGKLQNVMAVVLSGVSDNNIAFAELQNLLTSLGFEVRIKGGHFIYTKAGIVEIVNIQPLGNKAKSYQVKQVRNLILKYKLAR